MEKHHKKIAAVGEYEFPEEIIHQIQSFLGERKAAGTTLVSKSWCGAWSTRPNLSFDQYELGKRFRQYATKTLQRYEDLNLKIQTFLVRMYDDDSLARELILKAIKLGAIDLTIQVKTLPAFVVSPDEVLESQTLATLSVNSNLKSLTLSMTDIESELWRQFPCLKKLVIRDCQFKDNGEDAIRICSPSLECITISFCWFTNAELEFDVPNIRKLELHGNDLPWLEMKTSSREWESYIYITCLTRGMVRASWLRWLKHFVKLLSPSRVSLVLNMANPVGVKGGFVGDGLAIPAVENLMIMGFGVLSPAFLNALFWSCRPNFLTIERRYLRGIKKENLEQFQHLSSLPWNTLLEDSRNHWGEEFVRFQLK